MCKCCVRKCVFTASPKHYKHKHKPIKRMILKYSTHLRAIYNYFDNCYISVCVGLLIISGILIFRDAMLLNKQRFSIVKMFKLHSIIHRKIDFRRLIGGRTGVMVQITAMPLTGSNPRVAADPSTSSRISIVAKVKCWRHITSTSHSIIVVVVWSLLANLGRVNKTNKLYSLVRYCVWTTDQGV